MKPRDRGKLDGLLDALVAVGEITGPMPMDEVTDPMWELICQISARLAELAIIEANRLDQLR